MRNWSLERVSNSVLVRDLQTLVAQGCVNLAEVLAHIAEVEVRKLYREAAQPSMHAYCVNVLHFTDDAAYKRIHVARVARRVPELFTAIAEGRLHLSGACTIATHLTPGNAEELLAAVTHKTREQIQMLIAARAPRADLPERITPLRATSAGAAAQVVANIEAEHAPGHVATAAAPRSAQILANVKALLAPAPVEAPSAAAPEAPIVSQPAAVPVPQAPPPGRVTPLAPGRYGFQFTGDEETRKLLRKAQDLLADPVERKMEHVFKGALRLFVRDLERRKCGAADRPRPARRPKSPHVIPASVRREVWERDQGQCTFVNEEGRRCPSRGGLHMDHIRPKARAALDGRTTAITASDVRLLCHAHNQLEAERVYGAAFMHHKRELAIATRGAGARGLPGVLPSSSP